MTIEIKPLKEPIELVLEQFECEQCGKKCYINKEDKEHNILMCCLCGGTSRNSRVFDMEIKGIGEY